MHIGHAFSYTQFDFIARYKKMRNFEVYFPFGTDDNGLATEKLVQKEKGVDLRKVKREEAIKIVLDYLDKERPNFIQDWRDLGISADYDNLKYSTIDTYSQKISQKSFLDLAKKGLAYKKEGPIMWDRVFETAIAQAELEDKELKSKLNYIKSKIVNTENTYLIYATTRPELLFGCVGMTVEDIGNYVKLKVGSEYWIVGEKTYEEKFKDFEYELVEKLKGKDLIGEKCIIPLSNKEILITHDVSVKADYGTGIVYYCTYGGLDCIEFMARNNDLKPISIINKNGTLKNSGEFDGLVASEDGRYKILGKLKEMGDLVKSENIKHIVNVGERSGVEIEYITSKQWYIKYLDRKEYFFEMCQKFNWTPKFMKTRLENWIKGLNWNWGFSRQRHFGIPIPVFFGEETNNLYLPDESCLPIDPTIAKPKIKKKITFIRHSHYENNSSQKANIDPKIQFDLSKKGIDLINEKKNDFDKHFNRIITSDFLRTINTAKYIYDVDENKIEKNSILNELSIGKDGESYSYNRERVRNQIEKNIFEEGDENIFSRIDKLKEFLEDLKTYNSQNIVIITHEYILRLIKIINEKKDLKDFFEIEVSNLDIYEIVMDFTPTENLIGEKDVFDTWFTSASSPGLCVNLIPELKDKLYPMNLRPQGHDIISFWLFYTMAKNNLLYDKNPFLDVNISGWVLAEDGSKMSKSKGNTISPQNIVEKYSNDSLRYAAASTKLGFDAPFQEKEVQTGIRVVNKIFNANKFISSLLDDFSNEDKSFSIDDLTPIDKWIVIKCQKVIKDSINGFEKYDFEKAKSIFTNFFMVDVCDFYIEIVKQRLWQKKENYKSSQKALYYVLFNCLKGLSPIIPFICEEVYQNFYKKFEDEVSIHKCDYPKVDFKVDENILKFGEEFCKIVSNVRKEKSQKGVSLKEKIENYEIEVEENQLSFFEISKNDLLDVCSIEKLELKIKPLEVGLIGAVGTYLSSTLNEFFKNIGQSFRFKPVTNKKHLFNLIDKDIGLAAFPIENNLNGTFGEYLSFLIENDLEIVGEFYSDMKVFLYSNKNKMANSIKKIYSHSSLLSMCSIFIERNKLEAHSFQTTADAFLKSQNEKENIYLLGSKWMEKEFKLKILKKKFQDKTNIYTRFLLVKKRGLNFKFEDILKDKSKASILFNFEDNFFPKLLEDILKQKGNIEKIETIKIEYNNNLMQVYIEVSSKSLEKLIDQISKDYKFKIIGKYIKKFISL